MPKGLVERAREVAEREYKGIDRCVLAYSGGLDSNVMLSVLCELGIEVITATVDLGQREDLKAIERKARTLAKKHHTVDAKADFLANVYRGIKANCIFEGHVNAGALSRPVVAKYLAEVARRERAPAVAHGSSGAGNDQFAIENALRVLAPELRVLAPVRDWDMRRDEELEYARGRKLPVDHERARSFSVDENMWARTVRQGAALDQSTEVPGSAFAWTRSAKRAPDKPTFVEVEFMKGVPEKLVVMNERRRQLEETRDVVNRLNAVAGENGVGRLNSVEDKLIGLKMREAYECPAALVLLSAHKDLEKLTMTSSELDVKDYIDHVWNRVVYDGGWYTRLRRDLDAFIDSTQEAVDGKVLLELYKGGLHVLGRRSRHALYDARMGSRDSKSVVNQRDARCFAKVHGLQDSIAFVIDVD